MCGVGQDAAARNSGLSTPQLKGVASPFSCVTLLLALCYTPVPHSSRHQYPPNSPTGPKSGAVPAVSCPGRLGTGVPASKSCLNAPEVQPGLGLFT